MHPAPLMYFYCHCWQVHSGHTGDSGTLCPVQVRTSAPNTRALQCRHLCRRSTHRHTLAPLTLCTAFCAYTFYQASSQTQTTAKRPARGCACRAVTEHTEEDQLLQVLIFLLIQLQSQYASGPKCLGLKVRALNGQLKVHATLPLIFCLYSSGRWRYMAAASPLRGSMGLG